MGRARLVMADLGPTVRLRPGMAMRRRRRGRRVMMQRRRSGFGFLWGKNGRGGNSAEYGGKTEQERTAAEARAIGTLHNDLLVGGDAFSAIDFPMDLTSL